MASKKKGIKVRELNSYIKKYISMDYLLSDITVEGEISNFIHHNSGHMYFSLKDDSAKVKAVMFSMDNCRLGFIPKNGTKVLARGAISFYEKDGGLQLYVKSMEEFGIGNLHEMYLILLEKLKNEGLFDSANKKDITKFPKKIGVVTAPQSAALRDIIKITTRRNKSVSLLIYPSLVQGESAPRNLIEGITYLDKRGDLDCIIISRGGGSFEELFAFNDETLARAVFAAETPIVSAVGHEIDTSLTDFTADIRASTPSAAAELLVPASEDLYKSLSLIKNHMDHKVKKNLELQASTLNNLYTRLNHYNVESRLLILKNNLYSMRERLDKNIQRRLSKDQTVMINNKKSLNLFKHRTNNLTDSSQLKQYRNLLEETLSNRINKDYLQLLNIKLSLEKIERQLFSTLVKDKDGNIIYSIGNLREEDMLSISFNDGSANVRVIDIRTKQN